MLQAIALTTAVIRNGRIVPAGQPFGIRPEEKEAMIARGFTVTGEADSPKEGNIKTTPEKEKPVNKGNNPEEIQNSVAFSDEPAVLSGGSEKAAPKMKGTAKAKTSGAKGGK